MEGQQLTDGVLGFCQVQRRAANAGFLGGKVQRHPAAGDLMGWCAVLPPQVGGNPGTQLGHAERLGQVIVRTKTETGQHGRLIGAGRQKQNRRVRLGANAAADGKAVLAGHHHIQQDAVCPAAERIGQLCAGGARFYGVAVTLKRCF